jgi:hypothetical protein
MLIPAAGKAADGRAVRKALLLVRCEDGWPPTAARWETRFASIGGVDSSKFQRHVTVAKRPLSHARKFFGNPIC